MAEIRARAPSPRCPLVLAIGGHDPAGAGIQADIETCAALGGLALSVVTALTTQHTAAVRNVTPVPSADVAARVRMLLEEFEFGACKIGLVPDVACIRVLGTLLRSELAGCPLVLDPVLVAGSGGALAVEDTLDALRTELVARASVVTPNLSEALLLGDCRDPDEAARTLRAAGSTAVLVTDTRPDGEFIVNRLYGPGSVIESFSMTRFDGSYHGTGCTLGAAIACHLAQGASIRDAVGNAQRFVHRAVARAHRCGSHQDLPNRLQAREP